MGKHRMPVTMALCGILLMAVVHTASAQDLRSGVEQLAEQIIKASPEGKELRIAVVDFQDLLNVTSDLGRFVANRLTTRLAQSQNFFVVERQRLGQVLQELRFSMTDLVDPAKAKELGRMVGVDAIVVGTVSDLGNQVDLDARIIEIDTSRMLLSASTTVSKDQVVSQLLERGRVAAEVPAFPGSPSAQTSMQTSPLPVSHSPGTSGPSFQNSFLRITSKAVSRSEDKKSINLVLHLENLTKEDIYLSMQQDGIGGGKASLIDDAGTIFALSQVTGISTVYTGYRKEKNNYTVFTPAAPYTIVMIFTSKKESKGTTLSFSADCFRHTDKVTDQFSVGLANLRAP
jgi:curli biogenesis system outer membrane secretion channel CsgG